MMLKLIISIALVLLLAVSAGAQTGQGAAQSVEKRALRLEPYIIASAERYGVDARLLRAVCFIESRFRIAATSPKGALGPMQFTSATARRYGLQNPFDPQTSIDAAARYLRDLLREFGGRADLALAAYNAGEGAVESFRSGKPLMLSNGKMINPHRLVTGGIPPYRETQDYVKYAISLWRSSPISASQPVAIRDRKTFSTPRSESRDFTIDALYKNESSSLRRSEEERSLFIEIP